VQLRKAQAGVRNLRAAAEIQERLGEEFTCTDVRCPLNDKLERIKVFLRDAADYCEGDSGLDGIASATLGGAKCPRQSPEVIMELGLAIDADVDAQPELFKLLGLRGGKQRSIGAESGLDIRQLGRSLEYLIEAAIKQGFAAGNNDGSYAEPGALFDCLKHKLQWQLLSPPRRAFHVTVKTLQITAAKQVNH